MGKFHIQEWKDEQGRVWPLLEARGKTLSEAFERAAHGLMSLLTDLTRVEAEISIPIFCESADLDLLFSDWINSLIFEIQERGMFFSRFEIVVSGINVKGKIYGEKIDPSKHRILRESLQGIAFDQFSTDESANEAVVRGVMNDVDRHFLNLKFYMSKDE